MVTITLTDDELKMLLTLLSQAQVRGLPAMQAVLALFEKLSEAAGKGA